MRARFEISGKSPNRKCSALSLASSTLTFPKYGIDILSASLHDLTVVLRVRLWYASVVSCFSGYRELLL